MKVVTGKPPRKTHRNKGVPKKTGTTRLVLDLLGESPLPMTTADIIALVGDDLKSPRHLVWQALVRLQRWGVVEKSRGKSRLNEGPGSNQMVAYWRLTPDRTPPVRRGGERGKR